MFKLQLKNYRGFLNEEFNFSRVNILIGENSAGKSSIFKFLLALKQSLFSSNHKDYNITLKGNAADLGNYYEAIYNHEINRNLGFSFEFKKNYFEFFLKDTFPHLGEDRVNENARIAKKKEEVINYLDGVHEQGTLLSFEVTNDLSNHNNIIFSASNEAIGSVKLVFNKNSNIAEQDIYLVGDNPECKLIFESKFYNKNFTIENISYEKQGFLTIVGGDALKEKIEEQNNLEKDEIERLFWHIAYLLIAQNYIKLQLRQIEYINPLIHNVAERVYIDSDKKHTREIKNMKDLIDFLDNSNNINDFKIELKRLLNDFGIAEDFLIKKEGFTKEFRVLINNIENNIKDVGFGVSLQLPIFAQAIVSENTKTMKSNGGILFEGETLLIEQPEVHLHPKLQAKFVETLLNIGNNNVYFIETHSEHIIRMLQVLVKSEANSITQEDVTIHYFKKEEHQMSKTFHAIDKITGRLTPKFPKGFYDVSYDLAFKLIE